MITIEQAKRATELADQRERIIKRANLLRVEVVKLTVREAGRAGYITTNAPTLDIMELMDEFRKLIGAEAKAQVAKIDAELRALGVEPDGFDAAGPVEPQPKEFTIADSAKAFMRSKPRRASLSDPDPEPHADQSLVSVTIDSFRK